MIKRNAFNWLLNYSFTNPESFDSYSWNIFFSAQEKCCRRYSMKRNSSCKEPLGQTLIKRISIWLALTFEDLAQVQIRMNSVFCGFLLFHGLEKYSGRCSPEAAAFQGTKKCVIKKKIVTDWIESDRLETETDGSHTQRRRHKRRRTKRKPSLNSSQAPFVNRSGRIRREPSHQMATAD